MSIPYDPMWAGPTIALLFGIAAAIWAKLASRALDRQLERERKQQQP